MQVKRFIYATIDNRSDLPDLAAFQPGGINASPLAIVCYRDIAAVVSDIDINQFTSGLPGAPQEENHQEHLLKYQQVNAFLLGQTGRNGMLPLKFGFTADNDAGVAKVLEQAYVQLKTYLDRLQGTIELVIQATWELPKILQEIVKENPEIASADPMQAGKRLYEAAEVKKRTMVASIHEKLLPFAKDYLDAPLKTESTLINRSYLVDKTMEPLFDDAVDAAATEFEELLTFKYIGPLPVYSFVNIELNQGNFAMVDKARKLLELPEKVSWENIKAAYRRLIMLHHPDKNPGDPLAAQRTKDVVAAFEIIRAYCQSLSVFAEPGQDAEISFDQAAVEQAFIVDDKGAVLARGHSA